MKIADSVMYVQHGTRTIQVGSFRGGWGSGKIDRVDYVICLAFIS